MISPPTHWHPLPDDTQPPQHHADAEPVAWRIRVRKFTKTYYEYTERLPFEPDCDSPVTPLSEPEPLYPAASAPRALEGIAPNAIKVADAIKAYFDDGPPADGRHSDAAHGNAYELLQWAEEELRFVATSILSLRPAEPVDVREALEEIESWRNDTLGKRPKELHKFDCTPEITEAFDRGARMAFYRCADRARRALSATKPAQDDVRRAFCAVDELDWKHLISFIPDSGHGKFWKAVFAEVRTALSSDLTRATDLSWKGETLTAAERGGS